MTPSDTPLHHVHITQLLAPIGELMDDPEVSEVMINGPGEVFAERGGRLHPTDCRFPDRDALMAVVRALAQFNATCVDREHPILEGRLPDGSRVEAIVAPAAPGGPYVCVRRFAQGRVELEDLVARGCLSADAAEYLRTCIQTGSNILVAGGTGSGKSSLLNVLSASIADDQRIVVIEEARELQLRKSHLVQLQTSDGTAGAGRISVRDLLRATLRLRPDRIVLGEIRGVEALDLIHAMTSGHRGGLSTIHASHPFDALWRLETLCLAADAGLSLSMLRPQIASALDLIVQMRRFTDGRRRVTHICGIDGFGSAGFRVVEHFALDAEDLLVPGASSAKRGAR